MRISDWSSDVCSSDLRDIARPGFTKSSEPKKVTRVCRSTRRTASIARPATSRIRRRISIGWCLKVAVGRIILTCSAVALMALGAPLSAAAVQQDFGAWRAYMRGRAAISPDKLGEAEIGRAWCRARVCQYG